MHPILYTFRRCPYAIRARMTLRYAALEYEHREVLLKNKPDAMRKASPKATVPTMVLPDGRVLDESIDIISWALQINDPQHWLPSPTDTAAQALMHENDFVFKQHLDHYKYADRFPQHSAAHYREQACEFLNKLESQLRANDYLTSPQLNMTDVAIFPFIRQFAFVDKAWFDQAPYPSLQSWLQRQLDSELFQQVMDKYPAWQDGDDAVIITA